MSAREGHVGSPKVVTLRTHLSLHALTVSLSDVPYNLFDTVALNVIEFCDSSGVKLPDRAGSVGMDTIPGT